MFALYGVVGVILVLVLGVVVAGMWSRRNQAAGDPPDRRTVATFLGGAAHETPAELAAAAGAGRFTLGEGLLEALGDELRRRGLVASAIDRNEQALDMRITLDLRPAVLVLAATEAGWRLTVDAPGGGPGPRELLPAVDAALHALAGITDVQWHRRQAAGATGAAEPPALAPLDERLGRAERG